MSTSSHLETMPPASTSESCSTLFHKTTTTTICLSRKSLFFHMCVIYVLTLILTGSADIADNQAVSGALVMSIPGAARVVLPGTGHLLYLEKPDLFSSIVINFLTSHGF